jgi:rubrerythrin
MATSKSTSSRKPATKRSKSAKKAAPAAGVSTKSSKSLEQEVSSTVIELIDQAAAALRKTVETSSEISEKARLLAHRRAHSLINEAHKRLSEFLDETKSVLDKGINKIKP